MKFAITQDPETGLGMMQLSASTDIRTDIYMTLNTPYGSFFQNRDFGLKGITKISVSNILILKQNIESALKWMVLTGIATKIDVIVEPDLTDINRLDIKVTATQANGFVVTYQQYYAVGGPSKAITV
jgi:phage gp46-like protein